MLDSRESTVEAETWARQKQALSLVRLGQFDEAEKVIRMAIATDPTDAWNYMYLGNIFYHRGEHSAALAEFKKLIEVWSDASPPHWSMGDVYRTLGDIKHATESYLAAVRIDPSDAVARKRLRRCMDELDDLYNDEEA
jgi:tetratricopeptide (TPR) repeat protein